MIKALAVTGAHVFIVCALVGCHHQPPRHPGDEFLESIRFQGNKSFKDKTLREGLALSRVKKHGGAPDPYLVTVDAERVKGFYVRRGFLEVDVHSTVERKGDAVYVIYKIDEGPRATTRVVIEGLPTDPDLQVSDVRKMLPLEDGKPFDYDVYDQAKEPLLGVIQDAGYAHARLDPKVLADRAHHQAVVTLTYEPGPKCHFGTIEVVGVSGDLADAVRARVQLSTGQQFSTAAIAKTQRALYDMKRFSTVRVLPDKTDGDRVDVKISVAESAPHEVALGGGVGMDPATYEVRGRAGYTVLGWPWQLTNFDVDLRPAYAMLRDQTGYEPRVRALAKLTRIDLWRPFMTGTVEGGYNYLAVEAYTSYGPQARLGLETPLGSQHFLARAGWEYQFLDFRHISPLIDPALEDALGLNTSEKLGMYTQALVVDFRDHPIETRKGFYAEVRTAEGTPFAGGGLTFTEVTPEVRAFYPISGVVVAARARYGAIYGDVPVSERFYSGGSTTQRGFSERRLAPTVFGMKPGETDMSSVPIGGARLFESNIELRSELGKVKGMGLGGVVFLDGADVTETDAQLDFMNLNWAAGAGLRLFTLIGAVRADFGYRLNRTGPMEPEPNSHYAFHLSIGEAY